MKNHQEALGLLTEDQREIVRGWLDEGRSLRRVAEDIEQAPPVGFGIKVSHMSVSRFARDHRITTLSEEMAEQEGMAMELLQAAADGKVNFSQATMQLLQRKVFAAAAEAKGQAACEILRKLVEMDQRQQRIILGEKNFELSKLRFEMNTSRELMKKARKYIEVYQEPRMDDEGKVRKAREICFGEEASALNLTTEGTEVAEKNQA